MSKVVAIAGGSGNIAQEVIDAILDRGVYQIVILSRKDTASDGDRKNNVAWKKVDYTSHASLVEALTGIDTLLSFTAPLDQEAAVKFAHTALTRSNRSRCSEVCSLGMGFRV
ncbi:uncharacterized protein RCC_04287 [Ramularia collo-cygni]|uniref:NAD(P)-binding domain-containing protein n=1 Tax=Ramularia collo-cygni TaxID=112498 RepID=A0A2D3UPI9_9PEZI|nr:uncharacterized protein RCC_04287 [Ramularia collo-cygni]CZT18442.1 uncharacterized protein RCC_04287 [Ramularia collo-cygni]